MATSFKAASLLGAMASVSHWGLARGLDEACPFLEGIKFPSLSLWTDLADSGTNHSANNSEVDRALAPTLAIVGLDTAGVWASDNWEYVGQEDSSWMAKPAGNDVQAKVEGGNCSQVLKTLAVRSGSGGSSDLALRLSFQGCSLPEHVVQIPLKESEEAKTELNLLNFVCKVSSELCIEAKTRIAESQSPDLATIPDGVYPGRCAGSGVVVHNVAEPGPTSASGCSAICEERIAENLADPNKGSCHAYAWSERKRSCLVYDGWPVSGTDDSWATEGYFCDNTSAIKRSSVPEFQQETLGISKVFSGEGDESDSTLVSVAPREPGCFEAFEMYLLGRTLQVATKDLTVLKEMVKGSVRSDSILGEEGATAAKLEIQEVLVRNGALSLKVEAWRWLSATANDLWEKGSEWYMAQDLKIQIAVGVAPVLLLLFCCCCCKVCRRKKQKREPTAEELKLLDNHDEEMQQPCWTCGTTTRALACVR